MILDQLTQSPRTKRELAEKAGITTREVELLIHAARLEGQPIVSDSDGYRLTSDPAEVRECAVRLRRRLAHQALTSRAMLRTARRMAERDELTLFG